VISNPSKPSSRGSATRSVSAISDSGMPNKPQRALLVVDRARRRTLERLGLHLPAATSPGARAAARAARQWPGRSEVNRSDNRARRRPCRLEDRDTLREPSPASRSPCAGRPRRCADTAPAAAARLPESAPPVPGRETIRLPTRRSPPTDTSHLSDRPTVGSRGPPLRDESRSQPLIRLEAATPLPCNVLAAVAADRDVRQARCPSSPADDPASHARAILDLDPVKYLRCR
jgi:hypothetical protein